MLHQPSTCAAVRDARLLCQFRNINAKNEAVLSFVVWVQLSSLVRKLGSWVRIPLKARMSMSL
jgi:hypothetical protein